MNGLNRIGVAGLLLCVACLAIRGGWQVWRHYHPVARVTVEEVIDPAPVRSICDYIPKHRGCPGEKRGK